MNPMTPMFRPALAFLLLACTDDGNGPTTGELLSHETFSGGLNGSRWALQCRQTYSCLVLEENGNHFFRSTWRPWDIRIRADVLRGRGGAELAERVPDATAQSVRRALWYRWRFRVMDLTALERRLAGAVIIGQFHGRDGGGIGLSPPIAIRLRAGAGAEDDELSLQLKLPCAAGTPPPCRTLRPLVRRLPRRDRGAWYAVELHVLWSAASTGWVEWFVDGEPVLVDRPGLPWPVGSARLTGMSNVPNGFPNYLKIGQYVINWADDYRRGGTPPGQIVVDFDDIAIGTDRPSVNRE